MHFYYNVQILSLFLWYCITTATHNTNKNSIGMCVQCDNIHKWFCEWMSEEIAAERKVDWF